MFIPYAEYWSKLGIRQAEENVLLTLDVTTSK